MVATHHVDANERPADPAHDLGWRYAHHRADRLRALLATPPEGGESPETQRRLHADTAHLGAAALISLLPEDDRSTTLRAWRDSGAHMDADSDEAGLFAAYRHALVARVAAHPILAPLREPHPYGAIYDPWFSFEARIGEALPVLLARLYDEDGARALATEALADAAASDRRWGDTHRLHPLHVLADVPGLPAEAVPGVAPVALSGDSDVPRCTASVPGVTDLVARGSVARWVWDLADRDASRWGVPFGASGDPSSTHFDDQLATWADARTAPVVTAWDRLRPDPEAPA